MAHYAFIKDGLVTEVITGIDEDSNDTLPSDYSSWEEFYLTLRPNQDSCKRTSYNTRHNTHTDGGTALRGNYASVGFTYDSTNDVFIPPTPYASWILDEDIWDYVAPLAYPDDDNDYVWNEENYQADNTTGWEQV